MCIIYVHHVRTDLVERDDEGRALPAEEVDGLDRLRLQPNDTKGVGDGVVCNMYNHPM